jgi:hypothetical protein
MVLLFSSFISGWHNEKKIKIKIKVEFYGQHNIMLTIMLMNHI